MRSEHYARPLMRTDGLPQPSYQRASRAAQVDTEEDLREPITRPPRPVARRGGLLPRFLRAILRGIFAHWIPLGLGVLLVVGGYLGIQKLLLPVWGNLSDQWHYGDARIVQLDADVGHGGKSHFLAQWYYGYILLVEISIGDPKHVRSYLLTPMTGEEGTISLTVADVNRDDKPDLLIQVAGDPAVLVLYNTGTGFSEKEV